MDRGERFNSITHLVGSILAIAGTVVAVTVAARHGGTSRIATVSIYGAMLVVLYLSSTLYHSLRGEAKRLFHVFDHCAIYLLIAGTYTPLTVMTLGGRCGWTLLAVVWVLAVLGVAKDIFLHGRYRWISVVLYVLMGWLVVIAFAPLQRALPGPGITLLIAGGVVYTAGIAFFALSKRVVHMHGVWHLFVLGGSICHYLVVLRYIA
jgi:hemolysin III